MFDKYFFMQRKNSVIVSKELKAALIFFFISIHFYYICFGKFMISISYMTSKYTQLRNHHAHFHSFLVLHAVSRTISFSTEQVE